MRKFSLDQNGLIAEFMTNIGVAWFAAGVIGAFIGGSKTIPEIIISISWGIVVSLIFLGGGLYFIRNI